MPGYLSLVLHAHLPFVREPDHETFLEESWLFEAITETYLPLLNLLQGWQRDGLPARLTLSLSPTLCAMLRDPLLCQRYARHLDRLVELAEKEIHRTHWDRAFHALAEMYRDTFCQARELWRHHQGDLVRAFRQFQAAGLLEIITTAATHAILPLLAPHPPSVRAQILTARDQHRLCFGRDPQGIWLPECAYSPGLEDFLREAGLRWFILDTHGLLHAHPRPRYGSFAPLYAPNGVAVFARDPDSSRQVWSKEEGYPGDPRYRDFYRDLGFDLDFDYVRPHLPSPDNRGFTGFKYYRITGPGEKAVYQRTPALAAVQEHVRHFLAQRQLQVRQLDGWLDRPPLMVAPYDAELFGHWWYEGPEFLDGLVRQLCPPQTGDLSLLTPSDYLRRHPTHQIGTPGASSWGEAGYWRVWLDEGNEWIYPHLQVAQARMAELAQRFPRADGLTARALRQAARELLLAQASDWPFILRANTSPEYARRRVKDHLLRFLSLYDQLTRTGIREADLQAMEARDNLFPEVDWTYWR